LFVSGVCLREGYGSFEKFGSVLWVREHSLTTFAGAIIFQI
jgi:hypothetical protein